MFRMLLWEIQKHRNSLSPHHHGVTAWNWWQQLPIELLTSTPAIRTSPFINVIVFILIFILLLFGQSLIHNFCLRTAYIFCSVELVHSTGQQHAVTVQDHPFCQARLKEEATCITSALGSYFGYSQHLPTRGPKDATNSLHFTEKTQQQHKT